MRKPRITAAGRRFIAMDAKPTLDAVRPNAGLTVAYRRKLDAKIAEMQASLIYWLSARYKANEPEILAMDASPAMTLRVLMRKLARRWQRNFDQLSEEMAQHFAQDVQDRSDAALQASLRKAGFTVRFRATAAQNDAYQAVVGENIDLIKSIASKHLTQVQGAVMRSVAQGRDLGALTKEIEAIGGVTKRRAALIARDQNNKATAVLTRVRHQELGVKQARWLHSSGGKEPRPTHLANNGNLFDITKGWYDPDAGKVIWPGELINCRCVAQAVVPGFEP